MVVVLEKLVVVTMDGAVNFVIQNYVIPDAMNMVNAKMALAYVLLDGMENIALSKDVQEGEYYSIDDAKRSFFIKKNNSITDAMGMGNVVLVEKVNGNADVMTVGMVFNVLFN